MADPQTPALSGAHWRDLVLDGRRLDAPIEAAVIDAGLERTISGASTLTVEVHDPGFALLDSGLFAGAVRAELDGLAFQLAGVDLAQGPDKLTLTFEDAIVARLRAFDDVRSARRDHMTRAEFIRSLCREAGVDFYCPQLHVPQPIGRRREDRAEKDRRREPGFRDGVKLKVKGQTATRSQLDIAERILDVARRENAGPRATLAMVEAAIVENELRNTQGRGPDAISFGVFQCIPGRSAGVDGTFTKAQALDVAYAARSVLLPPGPTSKGGLIRLARQHPDWTPGKLAAVAINGGGDPGYAQKCDGHRAEATAIIDAYGGGSVAGRGSTSAAGDKAYTFRRGQDGQRETSWACMRRLADEVSWRLFAVAGRVVYITDEDLLRSRPRILVTPRTPGIEIQQLSIDSGKPSQDVTLTCRAETWAAPPGTVAQLEGFGPASRPPYDRWIVQNIRRASLGSAQTEITLTIPVPWKAEPRATAAGAKTAGAGSSGSTDQLDPDSKVMKAYRKAKQIDARHLPYAWGGGHGTLGQASGSPAGFDCSGGVSAVLGAAGLVSKPLATPELKNWGQAGEGKYLTVWVRETGDPHRSHTFIEFKLPGQAARIFEFGGQRRGVNGGFHPMRSKSGFSARHWEGT